MEKNRFVIFAILIVLVSSLLLGGCGSRKEESVPEQTPVPTAVVTPEPTPTPFIEPEMDKGGAVTFDGTELASGSSVKDGVQYVKLSEVASAIKGTLSADGDSFELSWRRPNVSFCADEVNLLCSNGEDLFVPATDICEKCNIGMLYDEENDHMYCTSAAGNWEIPEGYTCPVFMYHAVGDKPVGLKNTCVKTAKLEEQFNYLLDNGYTPIWFEDIENIDQYEKPVILVFDDGWRDNYTELWPLVEQYHVKVSICPVPAYTDKSNSHLTGDMIREMSKSDYVMFESHTYNHELLDTLTKEVQYNELVDSRLWITRMTGKQPIMISYPTGITTGYIMSLIDDDHIYRFGLKMLGFKSYNTSDDPAVVWRFFPERDTTIEEYASWLEASFPHS